MAKSKAPAFQFYPKDWLSDPQLRFVPFEVKGMWIDMLCLMWFSESRGVITGSEDDICRLMGCTNEQLQTFIHYGKKFGFSSILTKPNGDSNAILTVKNRRMVEEEKEREDNRLRQRRHYEKAKPNADLTQKKRQSNKNLTPPSPTPSPLTPYSPPFEKGGIEEKIYIVLTTTVPISEYNWTTKKSIAWIESLPKSYPTIDICAEIRNSATWQLAHAPKQKQPAHLTSWFNKAAADAKKETSPGVAKPDDLEAVVRQNMKLLCRYARDGFKANRDTVVEAVGVDCYEFALHNRHAFRAWGETDTQYLPSRIKTELPDMVKVWKASHD